MNFLVINWTAISAVSSAISAIIALIVVLVNVDNIKKTQNTLHMGNVPWFFIQSHFQTGDAAGVILEINNEGNQIIAIENATLKVVGTYKTEKLEYRYESEKNKEDRRNLLMSLPKDTFYLSKEVEVSITYKNQYGKLMRSTSPSFKISSYKEKHWHIEKGVEKKILFIPFNNEIA